MSSALPLDFVFCLVGGFLGFSFADDLTDHLYGIFMKKNLHYSTIYNNAADITHIEFVKNLKILCSVNMSNLFCMNFFFDFTYQWKWYLHFSIIWSEGCSTVCEFVSVLNGGSMIGWSTLFVPIRNSLQNLQVIENLISQIKHNLLLQLALCWQEATSTIENI